MRAVDTSIIVAYVLKEPCWRSLAPLMRSGVFLDFGVAEAVNAIWKAVHLTRRIPPREAEKALQVIEVLVDRVLRVEASRALIAHALRLAVEEGITVYDALFITLASRHGAPLATLDEKQANVAEKRGIRVERPSPCPG